MLLGYDPLMQFVHEEDCLWAFERATLAPHPGVFNVVAQGVLPLSTLLRLGGKRILPLPAPLLYRMAYYPSQSQTGRSAGGLLRLPALPVGRRRAPRLGGLRRAGLHHEGGLDLLRLGAPDAALSLRTRLMEEEPDERREPELGDDLTQALEALRQEIRARFPGHGGEPAPAAIDWDASTQPCVAASGPSA